MYDPIHTHKAVWFLTALILPTAMSSLGIKGEHNALIDLANGGLQAFGPVAKKKKKSNENTLCFSPCSLS